MIGAAPLACGQLTESSLRGEQTHPPAVGVAGEQAGVGVGREEEVVLLRAEVVPAAIFIEYCLVRGADGAAVRCMARREHHERSKRGTGWQAQAWGSVGGGSLGWPGRAAGPSLAS